MTVRAEAPGAGRPLVSILTPSFNQGRFLLDCLDSVARQTYRPLEHVVCDGGSTDGSVEALAGAPAHVHWESERDRGQAHALNKALARSGGSVVGWLNSDDAYADRRAVERAVSLLEARPDVDVVYGEALVVNEANRVLQVIGVLPFSRRLFRAVHYVVQPTVFFRRTALERESTFLREDLRYVIDHDLFLRLGTHARFAALAAPVAVDRHQRGRKVLERDFLEEVRRFRAESGYELGPGERLAAMAARVAVRARGSLTMARLPRVLEPALPLTVPPLAARLRAQLATPRRRMPFDR